MLKDSDWTLSQVTAFKAMAKVSNDSGESEKAPRGEDYEVRTCVSCDHSSIISIHEVHLD